MYDFSTVILVPFVVAFLTFMLRFYAREHAGSKLSVSFVMAVSTTLIAGAYLLLRIGDRLPPNSTMGFGVAGLVLATIAIVRMVRL